MRILIIFLFPFFAYSQCDRQILSNGTTEWLNYSEYFDESTAVNIKTVLVQSDDYLIYVDHPNLVSKVEDENFNAYWPWDAPDSLGKVSMSDFLIHLNPQDTGCVERDYAAIEYRIDADHNYQYRWRYTDYKIKKPKLKSPNPNISCVTKTDKKGVYRASMCDNKIVEIKCDAIDYYGGTYKEGLFVSKERNWWVIFNGKMKSDKSVSITSLEDVNAKRKRNSRAIRARIYEQGNK